MANDDVVVHVSHRDVDGAGAVVASIHTYQNVDYHLCDYENVNDKIKSILFKMYNNHHGRYKMYTKIFITDIGITPDTAEIIDRFTRDFPNVVVWLLDHHERSAWLNKYDWATVQRHKTTDDGSIIMTCGASLMFDRLVSSGELKTDREDFNAISDFIEVVRKWDTGQWIRDGENYPESLNVFVLIKGADGLVTRFAQDLSLNWNGTETILIKEEKLRIRKYIDMKGKQMRIVLGKSGIRIGVVFAEHHMAVTAQKICRINSSVDCVVAISMAIGRACIRTVKSTVDVSIIAEKYGGGGTPKRAGFPLDSIGALNGFGFEDL